MAADALAQGRGAFERYAWAHAYDRLAAADREEPLGPDDLERLATAAYLTGRDAEGVEMWARAHRELLGAEDLAGAVRCAFWAAFALLHRGEMARGGGWLARAQRLLDDAPHEHVEQGYLLFPAGLQHVMAGDFATAYATFDRAARIGERFGDRDLATLARHGQGRALIRMGQTAEGLTLLDEAMVAITAGEVTPIVAGDVYCSVIEACQEIFDVHRAQEWTMALTDFCAAQPDLVPYRGQCLVHRSELLQLHGSWGDAMAEVRRARARLSQPPGQPALGAACYQQAELHRLRGELEAAEAAYHQASEYGRVPQPGLALLWLARDQADTASAAIGHAVDEAQGQAERSRLLAAYVEIMIAVDDVTAARKAADELDALADDLEAPLLRAISDGASGAVLLASDSPSAALVPLRSAWARWRELTVPYEAARTRVLIGLACRELGDAESAAMEWQRARHIFEQLGAGPDLAKLEAVISPAQRPAVGGLTPRELEVLGLVAAGKTNAAIARDLVLSEHTVRRHLQNIFAKLGVPSRAAATAYAYEHNLV